MEKKILFSIAAEDTQIAIFSNGTLEYVEQNDAETKTSEHLLEEKTVAELKDIIERVANLAMDLPSIIKVYSGCGFSSVQILKKLIMQKWMRKIMVLNVAYCKTAFLQYSPF